MDNGDDDECTLGLAIEAQVYSLHPLLVPDYEKKEENATRRQGKALKKAAKGEGKAKAPTGDDEYGPEVPDWDAENDVDEGYNENKASTEKISARVLNSLIHEEHDTSAELRVEWLAKLTGWSEE